MNKTETEHEIAYEWVEDPQIITTLKVLNSWKKTEHTYRIKDTIYDSTDKQMAKHKVGVRVRAKSDTTVLTAKRYIGQGKSGESIFEEFHKQLVNDEHPGVLSSADFDLGLPKFEIKPYLEFTNRRVEVVYEHDDKKVLLINETVTYSDVAHTYTERLLEVEFLNVDDDLVAAIRKELEASHNLKMYKEGKTDRALRFLSKLKEMPLVENINDIEPIRMSAHGGKGLMSMKFFHQPYNAFASDDVDAKVIGYEKSNWDFFGCASLPIGAEVKEHLHDTTDEIYFILDGSATMNVDGADIKVGKGDCILTRKGSKHSVRDVEDELKFVAIEIKA